MLHNGATLGSCVATSLFLHPPRLPLVLCVHDERREVGLDLGHPLVEFPGDHCLCGLVERHRTEHQVGLHAEKELHGDHRLYHLVERHHANHQGLVVAGSEVVPVPKLVVEGKNIPWSAVVAG